LTPFVIASLRLFLACLLLLLVCVSLIGTPSPLFFSSSFWSYNQQAKASKQGGFSLENFLTFYLIIFRSFSLVSIFE